MTSDSTAKPRIRILVVEDSAVVRELLVALFESVPEFQIVGTAGDGEEAIAAAARLRPDVITMDINMPRMNGFAATREIMQSQPTPIVIVSGSWDPSEVETSFQAMEAGAVALMARPRGLGHPNHAADARELIRTVQAMAEVKVIRRRPIRTGLTISTSPTQTPLPSSALRMAQRVEIVAIGASTGGPMVLQTILSRLPQHLPFPIAIVQHIANGFVDGFVQWLERSTGFPTLLAIHGDVMLPGKAYIAPDGTHLTVGPGGRIVLNSEEPDAGLRPSVSQLFRSIERSYAPRAAAVLLTGMGRDGADELSELRAAGCLTIAQNKESCVVYGMPGAAVALDAATMILSPESIADLIVKLATGERRPEVAARSSPESP